MEVNAGCVAKVRRNKKEVRAGSGLMPRDYTRDADYVRYALCTQDRTIYGCLERIVYPSVLLFTLFNVDSQDQYILLQLG